MVFQVQSLLLNIEMKAWHFTRQGLDSGFNLCPFKNTFPYVAKLALDSDGAFFLNCIFMILV